MSAASEISDTLIGDVRRYYEQKLRSFGTTSRGVDWKDEASQWLRFEQLARISGVGETGSLLDFGCGYGALCGFLADRNPGLAYHGYDISTEMLEAARAAHPGLPGERWLARLDEDARFDYLVASGVFNVSLEHSEVEWAAYVEATLDTFDRVAIRGFAFNMLTSYSDPEKRAAHLYFADSLRYFDLCKTRYGRYVTLIHDYPLYEFTLLVRKVLP